MSTMQLTLKLNSAQLVELRSSLTRSMHEHEQHAAHEFGCSVHGSQIVRKHALRYMRTALESMRECHEVRHQLSSALNEGFPQTGELERLRKVEAAALRVASSRRKGIVTDQAPLDALDVALEAQ